MKRKGMGKGQGKGYKNIIPVRDKKVHTDSGHGRKQPQRIHNLKLQERIIEGRKISSRKLVDNMTGQEFSAHAGDYWQLKPNDIIKGVSLVDEEGEVKEIVRKKDLVDEILFHKATHSLKTKLRKGLKKDEMKSTTINGHSFDEKGRFIVDNKPSDTWTFEGIVDRWGNKVLDWKEYTKNPSILKDMKGSFYVIDMDNGTTRIQGKKINKNYPYL
jgi:hypothetical protein